MNCTGKTARQQVTPELSHRAVEFLRGDALVIKPRSRWPIPALAEIRQAMPVAVNQNSAIPEAVRAAEGRVLCLWGDAGWGREVARGKYETQRFNDALVEAAARLVRERWQPDPSPSWVTAVPSLRRTILVANFAERLAGKLSVPFVPVIQKTRETPPQKEMQNSVTQLRNLLGAFAVNGETPPGPVLLVDDLVDSGWTLTVLAVLLRQHGSGPVYPLALAKSSPRNS
jgi:ATP-dependent DNA helicase RecQ